MKRSLKDRLIRQSLALILLIATIAPIHAQKKLLRPHHENIKGKKHPYTNLLRNAKEDTPHSRAKGDYQKLLVILVDFQEDDDPLSTGNGKFELEPDPDYLYTIGAPPHDREYFEANLEAMRHYYKAVSSGEYNLQYDVWPKNKAAYTLSRPMSYYNPPNVSSTVFVSKMEDYFKEAFETADRDDPEIDFGSYAHYMIIHAGSDWQHDVLGDSPVDIPSFFIRVGEGKQAVVDNGATHIFHACNVPATISQDFRSHEQDGITIHSGYGALNSVLFHEFGHSLGLVDLYNVLNFRPMVGAFDIMDSGGAGVLIDELGNGDLVYVEGILPSLPGAFSRALLFEERFRELGLMKDITEFDPFTKIQIAGSSKLQRGELIPTIIKFPINENEYFLIENRSLDPDNDGGTAVFGALDGRVVLHPTAFNDPFNQATYEYDYLLPSFVKTNGDVRGGGILVWYVNEKVIYQEGTVLEDGSLWTNFQNNSVNTNFGRPGVMVLEADGIRDLGEYYSWYWTGTPYEYFHGRKPLLDAQGNFVQWTNQPWRPRLSGTTEPAMVGESGLGSQFFLDNISDPLPVMNFDLKTGWMDASSYISMEGRYAANEPINTPFSDLSIPHLGTEGLRLISSLYDEWIEMVEPASIGYWFFDHPGLSVDSNGDGFQELVGVKQNTIKMIEFSNGEASVHNITFDDLMGRPLAYANAIYSFSPSALYRIKNYAIDDFIAMPGIKSLAAFNSNVIALRERSFSILDDNSFAIMLSIDLPETFGDYDVVSCVDGDNTALYLTANSGNIYHFDYSTQDFKANAGKLRKIFTNTTQFKPSQPALLSADNLALRIFFGLGNYAYAMAYNGLMESGFPRYLDNVLIKEHGNARALMLSEEATLFLPVHPNGYYALAIGGEPRLQYSLLMPNHLLSNSPVWEDNMVYDAENARLLWYYTLVNEGMSQSYIHEMEFAQDPILWNGFSLASGGSISGTIRQIPGSDPKELDAYVFPNPVTKGQFRLRVLNAPGVSSIDIYDISGVKVQNHKHQDSSFDLELDSRSLSSGVYVVCISSGNKTKNIKFAVEK